MCQIWSFWDLVPYVLGMGISTGIDITLYFTYLGVCPNLRAGIKIPKSSTQTFFQEITKHLIHFLSSTVKDLSENGLGNFLIAKEQCLRGWDYSKTLCELCKAIQSDIYSLLHVQNPYRVSFKTTLMSLKIQKSTTTVQIHATVLVWDINMCYYWIPFHC